MIQILFPELSYKITGLCFKVHKQLGRFAREKQYADLLETLLKENQITHKRECEITNLVQNIPKGNRVDFLINNEILLDIKAKKFITKEDYIQMQRYLQASGKELGMIFNFRNTYLKPKRVLNTKLYSDNSDGNLNYSDRFKILDHKADLKIRAFGETKEELFLNMMRGMISGLKPEILNSAAEARNIEIKSLDSESLLVDFLSEVLYLTQVNKEIYTNIKFKKLLDKELKGELIGRKVQRFREDIKAVTYHELKIEQKPSRNAPVTTSQMLAGAGGEDGTWEATVLFDI